MPTNMKNSITWCVLTNKIKTIIKSSVANFSVGNAIMFIKPTMKANFLIGAAIACIALLSCDDTTDTLGNSLTSEADHFEVLTDTFFVSSRSIMADSVLSRNQYSYLGHVKDPETGTYITSHYTTQFAIMEALDGTAFLPDEDSIASFEDGLIVADSCRLQIYFYSSIGDSLNSMRLTVQEMSKPIEENKLYYTNFDPAEEGMLRNDGREIKKNKVYTTLDMNLSDSLRALIVDKTNMESVYIPLNDTYYDIDGNMYKNYGTYLMRKYYENPDNFKNSYNFIHNICPGFYIQSTDGIGVMSEVYLTELVFYFKYISEDSVVNGTILLSGTEEVMQTTRIIIDKEQLEELAADNTCTHLKAPAGIFTEVTLPVDEIKYNHENDTISSARIMFSCLNPTSDDSFDAPDYVLMLPKDSLYSFFENKDLPDNITSFISSYDSDYNNYTFYNISNMITQMYNAGKSTNPSDNWNKVVLVPVSISTTSSSSSSSTSITNVSNEMSLKSVRLVGGEANSHSPITISVIYNRLTEEE